MAEFWVITGMGGAGRSRAANTLEDLGWFVIDNLPTELLSKVVELAQSPGSPYTKVALVVGYESRPFDLLQELRRLSEESGPIRTLYLQASDEVLVSRYESTRRRHPAATGGRGLAEAIELERRAMEPVREAADVVIDTSSLSVHELSRRVQTLMADTPSDQVQVNVMSFGFSKGLPPDADLVIDCRYLPNPHWNDRLRPLTGRDAPVQEYLLATPIMTPALDALKGWLAQVLPAYVAEGRAYLTIALGCTGGQHRSVAMAELLGEWLAERGQPARVTHRELDG